MSIDKGKQDKAVIYSCIASALSDNVKAKLFTKANEQYIRVLSIITEIPAEYRRSSPQPQLAKVTELIQQEKIAHIFTPTLNHLFTVDIQRVMITLQDFKVMGVEIHTLLGDVSIESPISIIYQYNNNRSKAIRKMAAEAAQARGSILGRPKIEVDVDELRRLVGVTGSINRAAKMTGISHHTATRLLGKVEKRETVKQ